MTNPIRLPVVGTGRQRPPRPPLRPHYTLPPPVPPPGPQPVPRLRRRDLARMVATPLAVLLTIVGLVAVTTAGEIFADAPPARWSAAGVTDRAGVSGLLDDQAAALLAGDRTGWMAAVDANRPATVDRFQRLYDTLRALDVTWFRPVLPAGGRISADRPERVELRYCLTLARCGPASDHARAAVWLGFTVRGGRWRISTVVDGVPAGAGPDERTPWLLSSLRVRAGTRVVVAAPPAVADDLDRVAAAAELAAGVADRYRRPGSAPARYLLFLAGPAEWAAWYRRGSEPAAGGRLTVALSPVQLDVVLPVRQVTAADLGPVLRHEFGHVVTGFGEPEPGSPTPRPGCRWAAEGMAEYIAWTGPPDGYERLPDVRRYLRAGRWDGTLPTEIDESDDRAASATYGINYLFMRYLADRYTEPVLRRVVDELLRNGRDVATTVQDVIGRPWPDVAAEAVGYIRRAVR